MPEEIGIALVVLIVLVWLIAKILQAFGRAIGKSYKEFSDSLSARSNAHFLEKKSRLTHHVSVLVPNQLDAAEQRLDLVERKLQATKDQKRWGARRPIWVRQEFKPFTLSPQDETYREMIVDDVGVILRPTSETWTDREVALLSQSCQYPQSEPVTQSIEFTPIETVTLQLDKPHFQYDRSQITEGKIAKYFERERRCVIAYNERRSRLIARLDALNKGIQQWNDQSRGDWEACVAQNKELANEELFAYKHASELYVSQCEQQKQSLAAALNGYNNGIKDDVVNRMHRVLSSMTLPHSVPRTWDVDFDEEERILVIDIGLPDVVHHPPSKTVILRKGSVEKPLSQTERKEFIPRIHPAILLRVAHEVFCNDQANVVRLLVLNGWVKFDDPRTGANTKAYTASLMVEKEQIESLNLSKIDPLAAFDSLHGKSAGKLIEIIPIEPTLSLNRKDSRFVDAKAVLNTLGKSTNLAAMDWQDFEHLIRELFEKEFAGRGAEVKITQASRDRGVDAIAFDPDPIRGGKYVIQAKRYTNTVDVSAVRDLCAVVAKEGASRGILVTTSTYGADAYAFANNSPITLLNGGQLLGLLAKHGYSFRIDIREARTLTSQGGRRVSSTDPT
jgi:restriction system protein